MMDYNRIHILLDKYWRCITTIEEERELRNFFSGKVIPPEFRPYQVWFQTPEAEELPPLGSEFDHKIIERIACARRKKYRRLILSALAATIIFCIILFILLLTTSFISDNVYL
ncbi:MULTISPECIES: hypothetical protein [Parabacteroides]|jgi:hypothetical protein|nr:MULTISPECIES: hypothetical protein [Parabacteroides]